MEALTVEPSEHRPHRAPAWLRMVRWLLFGVVAAFVGRALIHRFAAVPWGQVRVHGGFLAAAVAMVLSYQLLHVAYYKAFLRVFHLRLDWHTVAAIALAPAFGKYVPGKAASVGGAIWMFHRTGLRPGLATSLVLLSQGLSVFVGLVLGLPLFVWRFGDMLGPWTGWLLTAMLIGAVAILHPRVFVGLLNVGLRRLGRPGITIVPRLAGYVLPILIHVLQWALCGLALWLVARAFTPIPPREYPFLVFVSAFAGTVGFLVLFAPAGLGVREGILLVVLTPTLGPDVSAMAVVLARLIHTICELGLAAWGVFLWRRRPTPPGHEIRIAETGASDHSAEELT